MRWSSILPKEDPNGDLWWGGLLLCITIFLLVGLLSGYFYFHIQYPTGIFAPTSKASAAVKDAKLALAAAKADVLEPAVITQLTGLSGRLGLLASQLGTSTEFTTVLDQINTELNGSEVHASVLIPLFDRLENIIQVGPGSLFWPGSVDRWVELTYWAVIGTLVFLLSEIKNWWTKPYQDGKRNFRKHIPWYAANFFRGPFIAMVILLALTSISFEAIGIIIDIKSAPIEMLMVLAAILGFYGRVANKQLDIIASSLLSKAWEKAQPEETMPVIEPANQPILAHANETLSFKVQPNFQVQWFLHGEGRLENGQYAAPHKISKSSQVTLLAQAKDDKYKVDTVEITLDPTEVKPAQAEALPSTPVKAKTTTVAVGGQAAQATSIKTEAPTTVTTEKSLPKNKNGRSKEAGSQEDSILEQQEEEFGVP